MDKHTFDMLSQEKQAPAVDELMRRCNTLVTMSRDKMSTYYSEWDSQQDLYKASKSTTAKDAVAEKEGRPTSQVVPLTYAKIDTLATFLMTVYNQRKSFYEFDPIGFEDEAIVLASETLLERDLKHSKFLIQLRKTLKNMCKFGVGVLKYSWEDEFSYLPEVQYEGGTTINGENVGGLKKTVYTRHTKWSGNKVKNQSPYCFFPDIRVEMCDFQSGEFCASENEQSKADLHVMEGQTKVSGMKHVKHFPEQTRASRRRSRFTSIKVDDDKTTGNMTCVTEVQMRIIPKKFEHNGTYPLGDSPYPVMFIVWIANDNRVIRLEPAGHIHDSFTYEVAQFDYDDADFLNSGLGKKLEKLQETVDWFINARVEAVTRTIDNQLIVDPLGVDMNSLESRDRVIKLKKGAARTGVDRYIKQLHVQDVTAHHMNDVGQLKELMQMVSGVNDAALGQFNKGRRSATEARVVSRGASSRLLAIADDVWTACLAPLGQKLLMNIRQGVTEESFRSLTGGAYRQRYDLKDDVQFEEHISKYYLAFRSTPASLVKNEDLFVFDGSMPSEKEYLAQSLQEWLSLIIQNPEAQAQHNISVKLLVRKIFELRGIKGVEELSLDKDPQELQRIIQMYVEQALLQQQEQFAQQQPQQQQPQQ